MSRIVFLLEEYSLKVLLDGLLPRLFPGLPFLCVPHEGKQDLQKSIPRKLRAWREPGVHYCVIRDNDGAVSIGCRFCTRRQGCGFSGSAIPASGVAIASSSCGPGVHGNLPGL